MLVDIAFTNYMQRIRIIIDQLAKNNCGRIQYHYYSLISTQLYRI